MKQILIFAGTTEGRRLAETLAISGIRCKVCVATEYGMQVMEEQKNIEILTGRLDSEAMEALFEKEVFFAIVDATHPFAIEVSKNIKKSALKQNLLYLRLKRNTGADINCECSEDKISFYENTEECAKMLEQTTGNIFLTTGSKELITYCKSEKVKKRLFVRVLPGKESIEKCLEANLLGKQILALQGPFSEEMNRAFIKEYQIKNLVTKETGVTGGYPQKISAAIKEGINIYVIGNLEKKEGMSFGQVCEKIRKMTGKEIVSKRKMRIFLLGTGMGNRETMTQEAISILESVNYVFGSKRLLDLARFKQRALPYYLAKDIIPTLNVIMSNEDMQECEKELSIAILFSGDSGFYSGCEKLYHNLCQWKQEKKETIDIKICPGIPSITYLSAISGVSWQNTNIFSIHGRNERNSWKSEVLDSVRYHEKTFLLVSGVKDLNKVGEILLAADLGNAKIIAGYQMSYNDQEVLELTPSECLLVKKEGLYSCFIINNDMEKRLLTHGKKDTCFIRDKIPMTKEEIREVAISKLGLYENAVLYDIGSGTGSIAVEAAERAYGIKVVAIEENQEAVELIEANCKKFHLENVEVLCARAPECFDQISSIPSHAFIGGSRGSIMDILEKINRLNTIMRVVITAISLETVNELGKIDERFGVTDFEIVQLQVSRSKEVGAYHLLQAENPIYICSFCFCD